MDRTREAAARRSHIPTRISRLFWDLDPGSVDLDRHRHQVVHRVLLRGDWEAIQWLRGELGDDGLRDWFEQTGGRGLDPRRLRFWELVLGLPRDEVDRWIEATRGDPWYGRVLHGRA
jgi:hypothetical protein